MSTDIATVQPQDNIPTPYALGKSQDNITCTIVTILIRAINACPTIREELSTRNKSHLLVHLQIPLEVYQTAVSNKASTGNRQHIYSLTLYLYFRITILFSCS